MSEPYLKIEISKSLNDKKEIINYYIIKNELYGLKISKDMGANVNDEEITIENAFYSEEDAKNVVDLLINQGNDFSQIQYVIEDYKKMYQNI